MVSKKARNIFLFTVFALSTIAFAGIELNWASAVGANLVPLLISYFIVRRKNSVKSFRFAAVGVVFLFVAFNVSGITSHYKTNNATISTDCIERNLAVAQMSTEGEKKNFCTCFSDKVTAFAMEQDALAFYGLSNVNEVEQSPAANAFLTEAFEQCYATL